MSCQVLRCSEPAAHVLSVLPEDHLLVEAAVCESHWAAIKAGEPHRFDRDDAVILMGADIKASGSRLITEITGWSQDTMTSAVRGVRLHVTYDDGDEGTFLVTEGALEDFIIGYVFDFPGLDLEAVRARQVAERAQSAAEVDEDQG